jgi:S1-C subfamily serine protease
MLDIKDLHEKIIYCTVLVRTEKAGGSGTVIASIEHDDEWLSYILTNYHVIDDAVTQAKKWDPNVGREVETEIRAPVDIGFYRYRRMSVLDRTDSRRADIVAYDKPGDVALLEMVSGAPPNYIATMLPRESVKDLCMGMGLIACGCSMGHKPLLSPQGMLSSLDERIENLHYWMSSTSIIFGNSGGGMYLRDTGEYIGIPSRLDVAAMGFSAQALPFLNYFIPIPRIYDLLDDWEYQFIFDPEQTYKECAKRRKEKQDELQRAWERRWRRERELAQGGGVAEKDEEA